MLSAPPLPGFTSLLSLSLFPPRRLLFPDPCRAYSCLISYFSRPVDRSSFLLYPQPNIPFFFSFLLFFFLLLSLSARSTSSSVFFVSGRFQLSSPARATVTHASFRPLSGISKDKQRGPVEFSTTGWNLRRAISKPAPVFPPNYDPD